jgi:hypothetical protein
MKPVRLFLPGSFEDAQLYMGHLLVFTSEREVRAIELEPLTSRLETKYSEWRGLLTLAFARNDWLGGGPVTSLARNPAVSGALNQSFERMAGANLELDVKDVDFGRLGGYDQDASVLDSVFYGKRMYLGTTDGLFHYEIDWDFLTVTNAQQRIDARCVGATAEYGAVNASCEAEGLFTGYDEFGWTGVAAGGDLVQTAQRSVRSAYLGTDLVNYEDPAQPELLAGHVEEVEGDRAEAWQSTKKVVTSFAAPAADPTGLVAQLERQRSVPAADVQFVWNSSRAFFVNTYSHGFFTAYRTAADASGIRFRRHGTTNGRVVAVHPFPKGWIVETDFRAYVLASGKLIELLDQEPMSVRTFEGSRRYKRLVAITVEDGLYLISAVGDFSLT